jgi:hypothetical protein
MDRIVPKYVLGGEIQAPPPKICIMANLFAYVSKYTLVSKHYQTLNTHVDAWFPSLLHLVLHALLTIINPLNTKRVHVI